MFIIITIYACTTQWRLAALRVDTFSALRVLASQVILSVRMTVRVRKREESGGQSVSLS